MITYKTDKEIAIDSLVNLYEEAGWVAYTRDPKKLQRAISQSLAVVSAWDNYQLVGLIRGIGDGETILYIQDILVLSDFQNKGIGFSLMTQLLGKYPNVRQKVLLTEESSNTRHFYEKCGFYSADQGNTVAFYRDDY